MLRPCRLRERHLGCRADDGHRCSQFVRGIGHELPLAVKRRRQPIEHSIEGPRQATQFVVACGVCRRPDGSRSVIRAACAARSVKGRSDWRATSHPPTPATTSAISTPTAERSQELTMLGLDAVERCHHGGDVLMVPGT